MRTRRGEEAIDLAHRYDVLLYDSEYRVEVTATQAQAGVDAGRDPQAFVLQNWPDSDEEAEQVVLREFEKALREHRVSAGRLADIASLNQGLPIHPGAAEYAADRLVQAGKLILDTPGPEPVYRLPRRFGFSPSFMELLRSAVCDDCASLALNQPFHETCLLNLIDVLESHTFSDGDVVRRTDAETSQAHRARPDARQWLARTAQATRDRWKSVLRPLLDTVEQRLPRTREEDGTSPSWQGPSEAPGGAVVAMGTRTPAEAATESGASGRPRVTKDELLRYLASIEIVEEDGEVRVLREERERLMQRLEASREDLKQAQKQRLQLERQLSEMQRDMDILIQAMRIAKRHEAAPTRMVDADFEEGDGGRGEMDEP
ncbi:MAG: hypothetical protein IRZ10_10485 [Thermoflavifilum sp.]|nr:hypothetical protein [Thermoflavifilum sp.]MCL6514834.1 hypothetical protein [Alicyclobacillus sp.]